MLDPEKAIAAAQYGLHCSEAQFAASSMRDGATDSCDQTCSRTWWRLNAGCCRAAGAESLPVSMLGGSGASPRRVLSDLGRRWQLLGRWFSQTFTRKVTRGPLLLYSTDGTVPCRNCPSKTRCFQSLGQLRAPSCIGPYADVKLGRRALRQASTKVGAPESDK